MVVTKRRSLMSMKWQKKDFGKKNRRKSKNEIFDDDTGLLFYFSFTSGQKQTDQNRRRMEMSSTNGNSEIQTVIGLCNGR
jgi:hypothetical protein